MRCLYPISAGFKSDGKSIVFYSKHASKEYASFKVPCGRCIECRLQYGMEWALRCVKEAQMYDASCFLTLTYNDENLGDNKLNYDDWQSFIKKLRSHIEKQYLESKNLYSYYKNLSTNEKKEFRNEHKEELEKIRLSVLVTGEYGTKSKRKHWHAIIFNYRPSDAVYVFSNSRGDKNYTSNFVDDLWGKGNVFIGDVTLESASYCARYGLKQLEHGNDGCHEFKPISKKSNKNAIGKKWLEVYWQDVFNYGYLHHNGVKHTVPRYFEKWFKKHKPDLWAEFVTKIKAAQNSLASERENKYLEELKMLTIKRGQKGAPVSKIEHKRKIVKQKLQNMKENYKL